MKAMLCLVWMGALACAAWAGEIWLSAEPNSPDPNEEVTVWVHTDEPLLFMELGAYVIGDATITSAMSEADCNEFGWENGWGFETIIDDPNGWVLIGGICWAADANDIVGYFKFRYHSGQVVVYIDQDNSLAGNWGSNFIFSTEALQFGQIILPPLREPNEPTPVLAQCPLGAGGPPRDFAWDFTGWPEGFGRGLDEFAPELNIVQINSDITTNQVWDANNVYYITDANGISIQTLLVIEPGTTVIFGYGCRLFVNNGGTLISKGTPDRPIIYTPDFMYFYYPEYIGYYWPAYYGLYHYLYPIYIEATASPATAIAYNLIEGAFAGIVTNNIRLDNPIENNYLFGNIWGIGVSGPKLTDIRNNLCFFSDQSGIEVYLADANDISDANSVITIAHNICEGGYWAYYGITVNGVSDGNEIPTVNLIGNIVSCSYPGEDCYGLHLRDGAMYALVANTGYFDNWANKNWEFDEYNPVVAEEFPYVPEFGEKPYQHHFLADGSDFIDAGSQHIEQTPFIGMTTNVDGLPDKNIVDLGFHFMDWDFVGTEEIAGSDIDDVLQISEYWLAYSPFEPNSPGYIDPNLYIFDPNHPENWIDPNTISYGGDWNNDGFVDLADFAILAGMWQAAPDEPNIIPMINGNPNDVGGDLTINADLASANISQAWLLMDGQIVSGLDAMDDGLSETIIKTNQYPNGAHEFKIVGLYDGRFVISPPAACRFNNQLSSITQPKGFEPGSDYYLYAISNANDATYFVELYDDVNEITTFSTECQNGLAVCIPYTAFPEEYGIYDLNITKQEEGEMMLLSVDDWVNDVITRKFDPADVQHNQYIKMVISIGDKKLQSVKEKCWKSAVKAAVTKRIYPVVLKYEDCTWDNLKFCLRLNNVKMWYHLSHGNHDLIGQPPRQCITTASGKVFSYLKKDYAPNPVPPGYEELSWWYENNPSLAELGLKGTSKMTWVQFNACDSAKTIEFPTMLGIIPIKDPGGIGNQLFIGWKDKARQYDMVEHYNEYEVKLWDELQGGFTLKHAFENAVFGLQGGLTIMENFRYYGVIDYQYAWFRYPNIN